MHGLGELLAIAMGFARDKVLYVGEPALIEAFDVALRRWAAIGVDGKDSDPEGLLPARTGDPLEPCMARSPDQHEQQDRYAYVSPHGGDLRLQASGCPGSRIQECSARLLRLLCVASPRQRPCPAGAIVNPSVTFDPQLHALGPKVIAT